MRLISRRDERRFPRLLFFFSENSSLPHISVLDAVAKHTHTHIVGMYHRKTSGWWWQAEQVRAAVGRCFLAFYYAAPARAPNITPEIKETACFTRRALWKQMSEARFLLIHPPVCSLHYAALFLLHLHAAPLLCSSVCFHSSKKNPKNNKKTTPCIHFLMLKMLYKCFWL